MYLRVKENCPLYNTLTAVELQNNDEDSYIELLTIQTDRQSKKLYAQEVLCYRLTVRLFVLCYRLTVRLFYGYFLHFSESFDERFCHASKADR